MTYSNPVVTTLLKARNTFVSFLFALPTLLGLSNGAHARDLDHSYANPEKVRVKHTHLQLKIDFDQEILEGTATLTAERKSGNILELDQVGLEIKTVLVDGESVAWHIEENPESKTIAMGEPLIISIPESKSEVKVAITYKTSKKAPGISWMSPRQTRSGFPFMFTMHESIGARSVFPCQDRPDVRGTYSSELEVVTQNDGWKNVGLMALVAGNNEQHKPTSNRVYFGRQEVPIPSYLFVLAAGRFLYHPLTSTIGYFADNEKTIKDAATGLRDVPKYYAGLEKLLGKNPWPHQDFLFLPAMFGYGGMENPQLIYINEAIVEPSGSAGFVMAHELAHQWTGNIITNETWADFWLNEGWTCYFEKRVLEEVHGKEFSEGKAYELHLEVPAANEQRLKKPEDPVISQNSQLYKKQANRFHPDDFFDVSVYGKGANLLSMIEIIIGRKAFDLYAKKYIQTFSFKPVNSAQFLQFTVAQLNDVEILNEHKANMAMGWEKFLTEWIYTPGIVPDFKSDLVNQWVHSSSVPGCPNCETRMKEFINDGSKTNFAQWHGFQITYLLGKLNEMTRTDLQLATKWAHELAANPSFIKAIEPFVEVLSPWYDLLARTGLWHHEAKAIEAFLSNIGRGRVLEPVYTGFMDSTAETKEEGKAFARSILDKKKEAYFYPVSQKLQKLLSDADTEVRAEQEGQQ